MTWLRRFSLPSGGSLCPSYPPYGENLPPGARYTISFAGLEHHLARVSK